MNQNTTDLSMEKMDFSKESEHVIYLAGGCFWGLEHLMQSLPGVTDAKSGYANGTCEADARYETILKGHTGFKETVRVEYNPEKITLDAILLSYFYVIDPTLQNRQGNDIDSQYQTGIYYTNKKSEDTVKRIADIVKNRYDKFQSHCGWPAFSAPIEEPALVHLPDHSHNMEIIEVRSRAGDSHLGHVFTGEAESPNGIRYCINSASLHFIPYEKMEEEGYGYLSNIFQ